MMAEQLVHPTHHPSDARLLDYVAGSLAEPMALVVATHLALCPRCRSESGELEQLGGALLDGLEPEPLTEGGLDRLFARLERRENPEDYTALSRAAGGEPDLPEPLRGYLGGTLSSLPWRRLGPIGQVQLLTQHAGLTTRLLSIRAGTAMPSHTHEGAELTLVLRGAFSDETGQYMRGDVAEADSHLDHQPVADPGEDCLCLAVTDAPLKLTGRFGRLVNPFVRL
jgi:putative transcriptional regulator